jgi:hypothetical protein
MILLTAALFALAAAPDTGASAASQSNAPAQSTKPGKKVCRSEESTGSMMPRRVCRTQEEWDRLSGSNVDSLRTARDVQNVSKGRL